MRPPVFALACALAALSPACGDDGAIGPDGLPEDRSVGDDTSVTAFEGEHVYFLEGDDRRAVDLEVDFPGRKPLYQSVLLRVTLSCPSGGCDWWNRIGWIALMQDGAEIEIARFVTPYRIGASFNIDVSDLVEVLRGRQTLRLFVDTEVGPGHEEGEGWVVDATFDFIGGEPDPHPIGIVPVWEPKRFVYGDPAVETTRAATVTVPDTAGFVAFRGIVTGHGAGSSENCAEFCERMHWIDAGDTRIEKTVWRDDCRDTAVPDQEGTWTLARAGWCSGAPVRYWFDILPDATPGSEVELTWEVEPYVNTCRPDLTSCEGCLTGGCDYDENHTEPAFHLSGMLIVYE